MCFNFQRQPLMELKQALICQRRGCNYHQASKEPSSLFPFFICSLFFLALWSQLPEGSAPWGALIPVCACTSECRTLLKHASCCLFLHSSLLGSIQEREFFCQQICPSPLLICQLQVATPTFFLILLRLLSIFESRNCSNEKCNEISRSQ